MVKMSFEVSQAELTEASHKAHVRIFNLGRKKGKSHMYATPWLTLLLLLGKNVLAKF